jgi:hypothetical protein
MTILLFRKHIRAALSSGSGEFIFLYRKFSKLAIKGCKCLLGLSSRFKNLADLG